MIPTFYLGIDIRAETFTARLADTEGKALDATSESFANSLEGYAALLAWLQTKNIEAAQASMPLWRLRVSIGSLLPSGLQNRAYD